MKVFFMKMGGVASFGGDSSEQSVKIFSTKILFSLPICPLKFSRYTVCYRLYRIFLGSLVPSLHVSPGKKWFDEPGQIYGPIKCCKDQ